MFANWTYNPENYDNEAYSPIPEGKYRVRIKDAEDTVSRSSGKDMIKLTLAVSGYNAKLWYYLVLDNSNADAAVRTDRKLGRIFDSFDIPEEQQKSLALWIGKIGGAEVLHEDDNNGNKRAVIRWFLRRNEVDELPAWGQRKIYLSELQDNGNINDEMFNPDGNPEEDNELPF